MSGHSKWANIKRKKAKVDAVKGTVFSRLIKEVMAAAKQGGGNPDNNLRLRVAIAKAKENNVPQANIERAIRRATGQEAGVHYEEAVYEGYGPGGTALYMQILTDNRNRTAGEIRHLLSRHGGSLGESGCVAWMFEPRGQLTVARDAVPGLTEERVLDLAIEAGADDVRTEEDAYLVLTAPEALEGVRAAFEAARIPVAETEWVMWPKTTVTVEGEDACKLYTLLELLEDHDDVSRVFTNADFGEDFEPEEG
ncbi:MAG: YebC/PmpR family DNA-binding transcriptional regulator [Firmicutes bacterium]|nr:YebC/PmpR family DNA-binding transcriptional regulator [Bacillota bacterium]